MRLLFITFITLFIVAVGLLTTRFWGQGQRFAPYETEYFKEANATSVVIPWEQNFFLEKDPNYILWADAYKGDNDVLLVKPWVERDQALKTLEKVSSPTRPTLEELLKKFPNTRFVVNVNDNQEGIHKQIVQVLENSQSKKRVLIQSDYNSILVSTKDLEPLVLYGSTPADITRLNSFDSIGILAAAPFKGDVFFSSLTVRKIEAINPDISDELHRRYKKIFLGPLKTKEDVEKARSLKADGFFVEDPLLLAL